MAKKPAPAPEPADQGAATDVPPVSDTITNAPLPEPESAPEDAAEASEETQAPEEAPAPAEDESPAEEASEPAEEAPQADLKPTNAGVDLTPSTVPEAVSPIPPKRPDPNAAPPTAAEAAVASNDPTPAQEAALQVPASPGQVDGSGILQQTNQQVIDSFPRNENGQVVIDENGKIVGLDDDKQPSAPSGSAG